MFLVQEQSWNVLKSKMFYTHLYTLAEGIMISVRSLQRSEGSASLDESI